MRFFLPQWEKITNDQWVLSTTKEGSKLEFLSIPPFSGVKETHLIVKKFTYFTTGGKTIVRKNVIEPVPLHDIQRGFYSTFFLVPKKTGDLRPFINLRSLNRYLKKQHFKMDSLNSVLNLVQQGDWAISLDLKDAYIHIPIHQGHKKFLRFCIQGKVYQFTCLCFGPTMAPRAFTKVVAVIAAHLRMQNMRVAVYLDDCFIVNLIRKMLIQDKKRILSLLMELGFMINLEKSALEPSQSVVYIGAHFLLAKGLVCPTWERTDKIKEACKLIRKTSTAQSYLHLLGLMASCLELVPNARLFMRPIQLHLLHFCRPSTMSLQTIVPFNKHVQEHLQFWLNKENLLKLGKTFCVQNCTNVVTTDASKHGYGDHLQDLICQGTWSVQEAKKHINWLELKAVYLTIRHFLQHLKGHTALICSDNTSVVQYLNKEGGTWSPKLCYLTWDIWHLARANNILLKSAHVAGIQNALADNLLCENLTNRMVSEQCSSAQIVSDLGNSSDRSVRFRSKQENTSVLHMVSQSVGSSDRRIVNCVGKHGSICISPNLSHTRGITAHKEISVSDNTHNPTVAKETLVYQSSANVGGMTEKVTTQTRSSGSTTRGP